MSSQRCIARMKRAGLLAAVVFLLAGCGEQARAPGSPYHSVDISSVEWGRGFHLADHNGRPRSLADFEGKVVMMFFGFTNCPDVCPTTMADLARVVRKLGGAGERVQVLLVTVDPARDTPEALARYVTAFHPAFLGLRGEERTTQDLAREFKAFYAARQPQHGQGHDHYMVDHTRAIYVFDRKGKLRLLMTSGRNVDQMTADVALLLKE